MRCSVAALALAGVAIAMPSRIARQATVDEVEVVQEVDWVTDVVTVVGSSPTPAPVAEAPQAHNQAAAQPTTLVQVVTVVDGPPAETPAPAAPAAPPAPAPPAPAPPAPAAPSPAVVSKAPKNQAAPVAATSAPAAAPTPAASTTSSSSDPNSSDAMLAVANKWRQAYGLTTFTWNSQLAANAQKTANDDDGTDEKHELNNISMAQVITPGITGCSNNCGGLPSGFELAYLAGWLCEAPKHSLTSAMCLGYDEAGHLDLSSGETGHADILNNPDYKSIGCAFGTNPTAGSNAEWTGLWICDLA